MTLSLTIKVLVSQIMQNIRQSAKTLIIFHKLRSLDIMWHLCVTLLNIKFWHICYCEIYNYDFLVMHPKSLDGLKDHFIFNAMLSVVSALTMMLSEILLASNITNQLFRSYFSCLLSLFLPLSRVFLQHLLAVWSAYVLKQKQKVSIFFFISLIWCFSRVTSTIFICL